MPTPGPSWSLAADRGTANPVIRGVPTISRPIAPLKDTRIRPMCLAVAEDPSRPRSSDPFTAHPSTPAEGRGAETDRGPRPRVPFSCPRGRVERSAVRPQTRKEFRAPAHVGQDQQDPHRDRAVPRRGRRSRFRSEPRARAESPGHPGSARRIAGMTHGRDRGPRSIEELGG